MEQTDVREQTAEEPREEPWHLALEEEPQEPYREPEVQEPKLTVAPLMQAPEVQLHTLPASVEYSRVAVLPVVVTGLAVVYHRTIPNLETASAKE